MLGAALKKLEGLHTFAAKRSAEQLAALPEASPSDWAAGAGKVVEQWLRYQRSKAAAIVADTDLEVAAAVEGAASAARAEKQGALAREKTDAVERARRASLTDNLDAKVDPLHWPVLI